MSFAKIVVAGTVVSDPEKRFTPNNNAVTNFNLSVENPVFGNRSPQEAEPFTVRVACWRGLADAAETQLQKGDTVVVDGRLMLNSYQTPEGVQKKSFEVEASSIDKLPGPAQTLQVAASGNRESGGAGGGDSPRRAAPAQPQATYAETPSAPTGGGFTSEELLTEDDIPF